MTTKQNQYALSEATARGLAALHAPKQVKRKSFEEVRAIVANVSFMDRTFRVLEKGDGYLLQIQYMEVDIVTGKLEKQSARKWYVSPFSTETEIVETAFKAARVSMDHVLKEHFKYEGVRVYSPHFNVRARMALAEAKDHDGRGHATSLEVIPTDDPRIWAVSLAGGRIGRIERECDNRYVGFHEVLGRSTPSFRTKTGAARAVRDL